MPKLAKEEPEGLRVYSFPGLDLQSASNGNDIVTGKHFGEKIISLLEKKGILKIHKSMSDGVS